jgi:hypothetical protein
MKRILCTEHKRMWERSRCTDPMACYPNHLPCPYNPNHLPCPCDPNHLPCPCYRNHLPCPCDPNHLLCPSPTQYTHLSVQVTLLRLPWSWNLLQPPVTRYQSTWCHTSEYFKNQCSCEKFRCKNTISWPCCTWYLSVIWSSFRPCPQTSPFGAKRRLQSSYRSKLRKLKDVYSHHPEHVMACSCTAFSWQTVLWYTQLSPSAIASLNIRMFPSQPFKYINLIPMPRA